jgi:hypothetical protein
VSVETVLMRFLDMIREPEYRLRVAAAFNTIVELYASGMAGEEEARNGLRALVSDVIYALYPDMDPDERQRVIADWEEKLWRVVRLKSLDRVWARVARGRLEGRPGAGLMP